jgi:PAS domain S-box-containing protein
MYHQIFLGPDPAESNRLQAHYRQATLVAAGLMLVPALLLVFGMDPWAGSASRWNARWPGLALLLGATSISLLGLREARPWSVRLGLGSGAALALLLGVTLLALAPLAAPGGDGAAGALTRSLARAPATTRLGPGWALLAFALLEGSVVALTLKRRMVLGQGCALGLLGLAAAALLTRLYSDSAAAAAPVLPAESVLCWLGLLAAALALLCASAGAGLLRNLTSASSAGILERRLLPVAALLPVLVGWFNTHVASQSLLGMPAADALCTLLLIAATLGALRYTGEVVASTEARVSGERERLRRLLLAHGHGLLLVDREGLIALANPTLADMFDCPLEALLGTAAERLLPEAVADIGRHYREDNLVAPDMQPLGQTREFLASRSDGSELPVEVGLTPLELDGAPYVLATVVDIRARRALEKLQKTQEAQLKLFIRHAPVAIAMLDHELRYIAASERWLQDFGLGAQSLVGRHHFEVFPQLTRQERDRITLALQGHVDRKESTRFPRSSGSVDWFRSEVRPWRDDRQGIGGVLMFAELITAQVAAEAALQRMRKETERLLRGQVDELQALNSEIVRTAQSGLLVYRASGPCLLANEAAARMMGTTVEQLLVQDFRAVDSWRTHGLLDCALQTLATGQTIEFDAEYVSTTEHDLQIAFTFSPVAAGAAQYLVVHTQDISSYIATQRELQAAGAAASQANQAKSMFIANMSHEIRTPMNAVLGLAYLLESDEALDAGARETASKIRSAGRGLMEIVDDILDLSKIEAGQLDLEQIPFRMSEIFARLGTLLGGAGRTQNNELVLVEPPVEADALLGDPLRIEQVLLNLGGNALKFTRNGEVEISAHAVLQEAHQVLLRLEVRDTGIGIAPELQQLIFEPFSQADSSTARRFGGTGLGLTICRKIVTAMGGQIGVHSHAGSGSTFWCELPLARDPLAAAPDVADKHRGAALVVDPRTATRRAVAGLMAKLGWSAETTGNSATALARCQQRAPGEAFTLILIDSSMTDLAAEELAKRLRSSPGAGAAAIILLMQPMGSAEGRRPIGHPADGILAKPLDSARLRDACARVLRRRDGSHPAVAERSQPPAPTLRGMRVMVVDDSATNLEVARRILERFDARVTVADSGLAALALLRTTPDGFDAVLMDIQMPDVDGLEATRRLRRELDLPSLPVIALSGGAMLDQMERARAAGMDDFVAKPFEAATLVDTLLRWAPGTVRQSPGGARASATAVAGIPQIEGIDREDVDLRLQSLADLFLPALGGMLAEFHNLGAQVREDLEAGAAQRAAARLHKLRGAAGNVGALDLAREAGQLERTLLRSLDQDAASEPWEHIVAAIGRIDAGLAQLSSAAEPWLKPGARSARSAGTAPLPG